jgi:hypothetical protein
MVEKTLEVEGIPCVGMTLEIENGYEVDYDNWKITAKIGDEYWLTPVSVATNRSTS